ncbi:glycosyltransferase [Winogradskyella aquimaris]|uniref:Glycosyltransferase n=1 Tax=Winogradskyella aquimaris TaxID=864074 RepID=A0ABU5ELK0_9FLAO|nr:glycosyltransferase [Winogradskyella aquimaris]MDY2587158.1 glycosyltransferase [Winogradskyella aquimaris]
MIRVLQIIDTLQAGGAERLAVNYANELRNHNVVSSLCATRLEGPLLSSLDNEVGYIFLNRKSTLDIGAVLKLRTYVLKNEIDIIHAHATSFFIATILKIVTPSLKIVWHDHYGNSEFLDKRRVLILKFCSLFFSQIFSVNSILEHWAKKNLWCKNVSYVKNFPVLNKSEHDLTTLKGESGKRILCLANLREQKNHIQLLEAFKVVIKDYPNWTLHCVGKDFKDQYSTLFFKKIEELNLGRKVFFYDTKSDILNILKQSTIGILVSKSEGLPLALLEYGFAELPVICTNVGNCKELISDKSYGILLNNGKSYDVAEAIIRLVEDESYRLESAKKFSKKVSKEYSKHTILKDVVAAYSSIK